MSFRRWLLSTITMRVGGRRVIITSRVKYAGEHETSGRVPRRVLQ